MSQQVETKPRTTPVLAALGAEVVGTFILVFFGVGSVLALQQPVGGLDPAPELAALAIGLSFGFAVMISVYAFGHISGAHINPTVTLGLAIVGRFPWRMIPGYLLSQLVGAVLASLMLLLMFSDVARQEPLFLGTTVPGERGWGAAFATEVLLGALLVIVVIATAVDERATPAAAGLAIGLTIGIGVIVSLNVSGGSFNFARSFGPMLVSMEFSYWWLYLVAPTVGGVVGAVIYDKFLRLGQLPG